MVPFWYAEALLQAMSLYIQSPLPCKSLLGTAQTCSYKPVLLKAIYEYMDSNGRVALPDVVDYFIDFYEDRKAHGMIAEKPNSIYQKGGYTRKDVEKNVLSNPFKRFEDMRFLMRCKDVETIEVNPIIFRKLTKEDWLHIIRVCDKSLEKYYTRIS